MESIRNYLTPTAICQACQTPDKDGNVIAPIASITKSFTGLTLALFFMDEKNRYLLSDKKANEITIKELLLNRKTRASEQKLANTDEWLKLCEVKEGFAKLTLKELAGHISGIVRNGEYVFSPKVLELSKLNNPSMFKRLDTGIPFHKDGFVFSSDLFFDFLTNELSIDLEQRGKFAYNNNGFLVLYELMGLMSDKTNFFEETRDRVLKPLQLQDKIMPFYEVPYRERATFPIHYIWVDTDDIDESDGVYSVGFVGNGSGSLCATNNALKIYAEQLGNFILGNSNKLIPDSRNAEARDFYKSFTVDGASGHPDIVAESQYSLGIYINKSRDITFFSHSGGLPATQSRMCILFKDNEITDVRVMTWQNEIYSNMANNFLLDTLRGIDKLDKTSKKTFENLLKSEFIDKNAPLDRKKKVCKKLKEISTFVVNNKGNKKFAAELKAMLDEVDKTDCILSGFADLVLKAL